MIVNVALLRHAYGATLAARHFLALARRLRLAGASSARVTLALDNAATHRRTAAQCMADAYSPAPFTYTITAA